MSVRRSVISCWTVENIDVRNGVTPTNVKGVLRTRIGWSIVHAGWILLNLWLGVKGNHALTQFHSARTSVPSFYPAANTSVSKPATQALAQPANASLPKTAPAANLPAKFHALPSTTPITSKRNFSLLTNSSQATLSSARRSVASSRLVRNTSVREYAVMSRREEEILRGTIFVYRLAIKPWVVGSTLVTTSVILGFVSRVKFTRESHFIALVKLQKLIHLSSADKYSQLVMDRVKRFFHVATNATLSAISETVLPASS